MLQWFKIHTEFLRRESNALSNDSNYKEIFQVRDNLFVSYGDIIVRINGTRRFPILIVYSNATPYRLPNIFPLADSITKEQLAEIAALNFETALEKVRPLVKFYYSLRHQNSSGDLCIVERDDLDNQNVFYGISAILQRVRDWHAGHITGNYPPDSEQVDFEAHFNFVDKSNSLFYPDSFLNQSITEGDFYAALMKIVSKGVYFDGDRYVYFGFFIDGISKGLIIENSPAEDLRRWKLHDHIQTSHDIYAKPNIIERLIEKREILKAQWFHIDKAPDPFKNVTELVVIIGNGDIQDGLYRLSQRCLAYLGTLSDYFYIAVRFPTLNNGLEFQLFKVHKKASTSFQGLKESNPVKKMQFIVDCYDRVEVIETEKLTPDTFHQRNSKRADHAILKDANVNILGVGALGSEIADCITKAGIGNILLVDNQTLSAHNAVRHLAGIDYIGIPKVAAVHQIISNHNPFVTIATLASNLYSLDVASDIEDNSISISSVADDNVEAYLNQEFVLAGRTIFYVRALRGGKTARIFRVNPGKDPCFQCLHLHRGDETSFVEIAGDPDYPTLKNECNNPIRPASAADLKLISSIASRILIDHLQNGASEYNHWIWSADEIPGTQLTKPGQLYSQHIPPHPDCVYCSIDSKVGVTITKDSIKTMQDLISADPTIETGGVLAGRVTRNGDVVVTHASGPGPNAKRTRSKFEKDVEFCQHFLDEAYEASGQGVVYVGEWHSHPSSDNRPSGTDLKSLSEIAIARNYITARPIMLIFTSSGHPSCTVHPAGKLFYHTDLIISET